MIKLIVIVDICFCVLLASTEERYNEDDESVIVNADNHRDSRQILLRSPGLPVFNPYLLHGWTSLNANPFGLSTLSNACYTNKGVKGKCVSFRQCYPYFKENTVDNWILGLYDTCNYFTTQGRQMFGVCCPNTSKPIPPDTSTVEPPVVEPEDPNQFNNSFSLDSPKISYYPPISNWPPPIPTHPPDHTIPPLPTHPPSPGYPTVAPPSAWPPTARPPATLKPSYKPPVTAKPPATKPPNPPSAPAGNCGAKNGYQDRIVGGHNADVNEWPWIAALFNGGRQFCGGSLIDSIHILSAAHCVAHMSSWDVARLTVRLGDHNIRTNSEVRHIEKRVKRVVRHRGFDPRTLYNDIAILTMDSPVEFNQQIRPVCLPSTGAEYAGRTATVIGWGSLRESGPQPAVLQEVSIPIWSNADCKLKYGPAAPGGIVEHMLCAGQANRDSCSGDSGGPLMVNDGKWTQVGIVSWGIGCGKGQYPGVYTRVMKFLPWIYKNLK